MLLMPVIDCQIAFAQNVASIFKAKLQHSALC